MKNTNGLHKRVYRACSEATAASWHQLFASERHSWLQSVLSVLSCNMLATTTHAVPVRFSEDPGTLLVRGRGLVCLEEDGVEHTRGR